MSTDAEVSDEICKNCRQEIWWVDADYEGPAGWLSAGDDVCGIADGDGRITWDLSIDHTPAERSSGDAR